jgi:glycosyltransferase involved in cell wall biosynthesis
LAAARALDLRVTSDFRTNFHQYSRYYGLGLLAGPALSLLRRFHNLTDRTFVPTRTVRRELAEAGFQRLAIVGRGVDGSRFAPARRSDALRTAWQAGRGPVLLTVGRVAAEKNVELALRAFERVRELQPEARMIVVGDGPARARLEAAHPAAQFVGVQRGEALAEHYASADLFLFPSLSDTFGNVVLEALASGLPVVSFEVAAAAEHVQDGVSGRLVLPGDEAAFIAETVALAGDTVRLATMREAAVAAAARAAWPQVLAGFEAQLEATLHESEAPSAPIPVVA